MNTTSRGTRWVVGQFVLFGAILLAPRGLPWLPAWTEAWRRVGLVAGLILGLLGVGIAGAGALGLGANLTPFPRPRDDGTLVQGGIYSLVRHPIYCGVLLTALAWSLVRGSTPALLLSLVLGLFFDRKANYEEQWLMQRFADYAGYRQRVKKLLPWIY